MIGRYLPSQLAIRQLLCCLYVSGVTIVTQAAIYKHMDVHGRVTYSSAPMKGAIRITTDPEEKKRETDRAESFRQARKTATPKQNSVIRSMQTPMPMQTSPGSPTENLPRTIDTMTQKARDSQRSRILATELHSEMAMQQETQLKLTHERSTAYPSVIRIQQLEDDLCVHNNNIGALQKEIQRMR